MNQYLSGTERKRDLIRLTFYSKKDCWLCDMAEEMLNGLREQHDIEIKKVAFDSDNELYELYRFDIPVIEFRDGSALHGRIRKKDLLEKLKEHKK